MFFSGFVDASCQGQNCTPRGQTAFKRQREARICNQRKEANPTLAQEHNNTHHSQQTTTSHRAQHQPSTSSTLEAPLNTNPPANSTRAIRIHSKPDRERHPHQTTTMSTGNPAPTYADCVASLRTSLSFLESSVATLGTGVHDFPRLSSVLKTVRVMPPFPNPHLPAS